MIFLLYNGEGPAFDGNRLLFFNKIFDKAGYVLCLLQFDDQTANEGNFGEAVSSLSENFVLFVHSSKAPQNITAWPSGGIKANESTIIFFSGGGFNPIINHEDDIGSIDKAKGMGFSRVWYLKDTVKDAVCKSEFSNLLAALESDSFDVAEAVWKYLNGESIAVRSAGDYSDKNTTVEDETVSSVVTPVQQRGDTATETETIDIVPDRLLEALWILAAGSDKDIPAPLYSRALQRTWWIKPFQKMDLKLVKKRVAENFNFKGKPGEKTVELLGLLDDTSKHSIDEQLIKEVREELKGALCLV